MACHGCGSHDTATVPRLRIRRGEFTFYVMLCPVLLLAFFAAAQGRAVNISNTWVLPEEGFPVFYRYFRDRISWYEADAVCQFHHANLVTVDTTAQYDALRAYLKELDISSAVWVGLIRSNPDGEFTWTDYRGLGGDGYWSAAPDTREAPLCAAANPAADYRWEARACGGPTVASFICELPVPQWALGNQGCMVKALPAVTVLYLPESAAVQLTADCGLAGTKQVQCTGNVKHENLLSNLSCADEDETPVSSMTSVTVSLTLSSDTSFGDQDLTSDVTTEELNISTEHFEASEESILKSSPAPLAVKTERKPTQKQDAVPDKFRGMYTQKNVNIDLTLNNNLQSNDIPKLATNENVLTLEESEKLEDEKHMQHKLLHDELARHGNFETIFTQPTDHFVPPLVMAKAKISDDMTVLSLSEKHAQQLAEQRFIKHKPSESHFSSIVSGTTTEEPSDVEIIEKPLVMTIKPTKLKYTGKKNKTKLGLPKKYNEKYTDPKGRNIKIIESKSLRNEKPTESPKSLSQIDMAFKTTTQTIPIEKEDDTSMDLTVMLKELGVDDSRVSRYSNLSNTVPKETKLLLNVTEANVTLPSITSPEIASTTDYSGPERKTPVSLNHEVIKITTIDEDKYSSSTPSIFEIITRRPVVKDETTKFTKGAKLFTLTQTATEAYENSTTDLFTTDATINMKTESVSDTVKEHSTTRNENSKTSASEVSTTAIYRTDLFNKLVYNGTISEFDTYSIKTKTNVTYAPLTSKDNAEDHTIKHSTADIITKAPETSEAITENHHVVAFNITADTFNITIRQEGDFTKASNESLELSEDFQSPLLSAANEPMHRPNRLRRPQPPLNHMNKFNPFRILG